jgi:hypothetical protein
VPLGRRGQGGEARKEASDRDKYQRLARIGHGPSDRHAVTWEVAGTSDGDFWGRARRQGFAFCRCICTFCQACMGKKWRRAPIILHERLDLGETNGRGVVYFFSIFT